MDPDHILQGTQDALTARRVFGEPIHTDGATILPVAVIGGGGGGNGKNGTDGGGVGFGLLARPAGVYVIKDGERLASGRQRELIVAGGQLVAIAGIVALRSFFAAGGKRPTSPSTRRGVTPQSNSGTRASVAQHPDRHVDAHRVPAR